MNFLVIGHSVVDRIIDKNRISIKPGGIYYTIISLLSQLKPVDKLYLCSDLDKENEILFKDAYDRIEKEFLVYVESIPKVELVVNNASERKETYSQIAQNLSLPAGDLNRFDGILINMISGYDISLDQFKKLRKNFNRLIYFDVHTFSRGMDEKGHRIFRRINDFNEWAVSIDVLQANELELSTLSDQKEEAIIIEKLFSYGIRQIIITRAERGATVFFRENDLINKIHNNALQVKASNKVGCGDVFGAVYFYHYIKNKNVLLALEQANLFAGIATTYSETKEFLNLKRDASERISKK
ncbi:MAG: PfkB family carbohydrate kinase [Ignavibacteriaceae bacterium]|nr:PfkB family carbohydrate kinase [Ignavibacteriaceae bacterium]